MSNFCFEKSTVSGNEAAVGRAGAGEDSATDGGDLPDKPKCYRRTPVSTLSPSVSLGGLAPLHNIIMEHGNDTTVSERPKKIPQTSQRTRHHLENKHFLGRTPSPASPKDRPGPSHPVLPLFFTVWHTRTSCLLISSTRPREAAEDTREENAGGTITGKD